MAFVIVHKVAVKCDGCDEMANAADDAARALIHAHMNGWRVTKTQQMCPSCVAKSEKPTRRKRKP